MKKILLVEDDQRYRDLLKKHLSEEGYHILTAEDGEKAIEQVTKEKIDLIILDLLMPHVDGVSFYYQLTHVLKKHIPFIVLTNVSDASGFNGDLKEILIKTNVSLEDISAKVREYLK